MTVPKGVRPGLLSGSKAVSEGDLSSDDQSRSMLAGYQPKLLLARFGDQWHVPRGRAHSTHILKPRLLGDNDVDAKNIGILHLPGRSVLADVYDAVPNLFRHGRINYDLALAVDRSFDHRRISAAHLIRDCGPACLEREASASGPGDRRAARRLPAET
jgi:hypothetical protein